MKTREAIAKRIEELCEQNNLTINGLATQAAVPPSTVKNIIYGVSRNPGIVTIKMLCDGLDISIQDFFDSPLFNDLEQEIE
ncbi:helix-turn-helix transcriptional regulator [Ruminococcus sp.]|uniref:helix-turn-helix domain-containing protein n=1 Tax=Ruminococcus sp. TaxID=41978 RepID=UPI0025E234A8|nr:helix-turn-helix transcriptional regulator [Ruminococcus sp.]MBR1432761.1 helix-turn-helix transcriptional regulator [Ruminococcus sp.]